MDDFTFSLTEACTEEQWKEFFSSACWREFQDTVKMRLSMTRTELESCNESEFPRLQGEAKSIRFDMAFQDLVLAEFESKRKEQDNGDSE